MSTTNKKAYIYKMKLGPANLLCLIVMVALYLLSVFVLNIKIKFDNTLLLFTLMILYLMFHEFLHGIGYLVGGCKSKNIQYGICLEKGIFYAMAYQELTKKNILISLQMPFMVIGVITYIIGIIFNIPILVLLSIINISGASMDLAMFYYISKLKDVTYSESGNPDEFVLISGEDLTKKKNMFLEIVEKKDYKKEDYVFPKPKKLVVTKLSIVILIAFIVLGFVCTII